jgi:hypothetical protein
MKPRTTSLLFFSVLAAGALGCGEDFDPYNRLTGLRVLAIKAEPPAPALGETTTLTPLVYTPEGAGPVTFAWSWCPVPGPASEGYPCQVREEDLKEAAMAAGLAAPSFDLGTGATATLTHSLPPALLQLICADTPGLPRLSDTDCRGGFPVQILVRAKTASDELISVRTVRLRFAPDHEPNANPFIDGLTVRLEDDDMDRPLTDVPEQTLPRAKDTPIKATVSPSVLEMYNGRDANLNPVRRQEELTLSWFVESGDTESARTRFAVDGFRPEKAFENEWNPDRTKDYSRDTARLIVVIRDDRGGVGWRSAAVKLGATP